MTFTRRSAPGVVFRMVEGTVDVLVSSADALPKDGCGVNKIGKDYQH